MSLDMDKEFSRHQKDWADFAKWAAVGTAVVIAIVGILALTRV